MNPVSTRSQRFITNHSPNDDYQKRNEALTLTIQDLKTTVQGVECRVKNLQETISQIQFRRKECSVILEEIKQYREFYQEMDVLEQRLANPISPSILSPLAKRVMRFFEKLFF